MLAEKEAVSRRGNKYEEIFFTKHLGFLKRYQTAQVYAGDGTFVFKCKDSEYLVCKCRV